jgi:hypothetical protein
MEDVALHSAPLRKIREAAREQLAALPEPKPIPTVDEVDPEAFRRHVLEAWRSKDIRVQRKALARLIDEVTLLPGKAVVRYSWKTDADAYTYQEPYGPPYAPMSLRVPSTS